MRIRLVPGQSSHGNFNVQISMPPRGAGSAGGVAPGGVVVPYVAQCISLFPSGDYQTAILALYGLAEGAAVRWSIVAAETWNFLQNGISECLDSVCLACSSGGVLVVQVEVDGVVIGTIDVGAYFDSFIGTCISIEATPP